MSTATKTGTGKPTDEEQALVARWRTDALDKMPYMAAMLFSLRLVNAPGLGTFAVDPGHRLYIDFDSIAADPHTWTPQVCAEALLHECGHLFGNHNERGVDAGVRTPQEHGDFNAACFPRGTLLPGNVPIETVATMVREYAGDLVGIATQVGNISATTEHPFFARHRWHKKGIHPIVLNEPGWVEAKYLSDGDYILVPKLTEKRTDTTIDLSGYALRRSEPRGSKDGISNRTVRSIPLTSDTAWLIGLYVAEGSSSPAVRFSLASYEHEIHNRIGDIAASIGYSASRSYNLENHACSVALGTTVFGRWLKEHCGARASEKHIPAVILNHVDPAIRQGCIEGVADGDGYQRDWDTKGAHHHRTVSTSSKSLMHDIVLLLAQDGIGAHTRVQP